MSDKFKRKSWLTAAAAGVLFSAMGSSAMAVTNVEDFLTTNLPADIANGATGLVAGDTALDGNLYRDFGGTNPFNGQDVIGDEDAFTFYLDGTSTFTAELDFVDGTFGVSSDQIRPLVQLYQEIGAFWRLAASSDPTTGLISGSQSIPDYDPANPPTQAALAGNVGGAGNYLLLITGFGNSGNNGTNPLTSLLDGGAIWNTMEGASTSADYTVVVSGIATASAVPVPAAVWLFGSGLMGLVGVARRRKS